MKTRNRSLDTRDRSTHSDEGWSGRACRASPPPYTAIFMVERGKSGSGRRSAPARASGALPRKSFRKSSNMRSHVYFGGTSSCSVEARKSKANLERSRISAGARATAPLSCPALFAIRATHAPAGCLYARVVVATQPWTVVDGIRADRARFYFLIIPEARPRLALIAESPRNIARAPDRAAFNRPLAATTIA